MSNTLKIKKDIIYMLLMFSTFQFGCKKDDSNKVIVQLYLIDAPAQFDSVFINLQSLEFIKEGAESGDVLNFNRQGLYNVLKFNNGKDTLLGTIRISPGVMSKVKLNLSTGNSIWFAGQQKVLNNYQTDVSSFIALFSDSIKLKNSYRYWLDIDIARSIIADESGYSLNPVFRVFSEENTGSLYGEVIPASTRPFIQAVSSKDTIGTIADNDGTFLIRGLPEGLYSVTACSQNGLDSISIDNIKIEVGKATDAGRFLIY